MKEKVLENKLVILGAILGAVAGLMYWYFVGCANGSCMITSRPLNSGLYGALMGGLFFSIIKNEKKIKK